MLVSAFVIVGCAPAPSVANPKPSLKGSFSTTEFAEFDAPIVANSYGAIRVTKNGTGKPDTEFHLKFLVDQKEGALQNYRQSQEISTGISTTEFTQDGVQFTVTCFAPLEQSFVGMFVEAKADQKRTVEVQFGRLAPTEFVRFETGQAEGLASAILEPGQTASLLFLKDASGANRGFPEKPLELARAAKVEPQILIEGSESDQKAVNSMLSNLIRMSDIDVRQPHSPFGPTREKYKAMFWDSDLWIFPALAFTAPLQAGVNPNTRLQFQRQAQQNYLIWKELGSPIGKPEMQVGPVVRQLKPGEIDRNPPKPDTPMRWPWESVSGQETTKTISYYQEHISGSVCLGLSLASALGYVKKSDVDPILIRTADFLFERSVKTQRGWEMKGVTSPDESHIGDNDFYTNAVAELLVNSSGTPKLDQLEPKGFPAIYYRPTDRKGFLNYNNDEVRGYKQAAALLAVFPLQDRQAEEQAMTMLNRFADKVTPNGPAMSKSLNALIEARFGDPDKAYKRWQDSYKTYCSPRFLNFAEKPVGHEDYFLTGAAGCLNTVIYGFAGFRIDPSDPGKKLWKTELKNGHWLSITPHLPKAWKSITLKDFTILGKKTTFTITQNQVEAVQAPS